MEWWCQMIQCVLKITTMAVLNLLTRSWTQMVQFVLKITTMAVLIIVACFRYQMTQFVLKITNMAVLNVVARSRRPMLQFVLMIMAMRLTLTIRSLTAVPGSPSCFWCRAWGMDAPRRRGGTVSGMVVVLKYVNKVAVPQVARSGMTMIQYVLKITMVAVLKLARSR